MPGRFKKKFFRLNFSPGYKFLVATADAKAKLIVECDGSQHQDLQKSYDKNRDLYLKQCGYKILRFWNNDVLTNIEGVWQIISENLLPPGCPHPSLPPQGEGKVFGSLDAPILFV